MQVLKLAQVAQVSTKAQKISRKIIISKIFSCQENNAEEDIDFINMPSQIPISDDNFFLVFTSLFSQRTAKKCTKVYNAHPVLFF